MFSLFIIYYILPEISTIEELGEKDENIEKNIVTIISFLPFLFVLSIVFFAIQMMIPACSSYYDWKEKKKSKEEKELDGFEEWKRKHKELYER